MAPKSKKESTPAPSGAPASAPASSTKRSSSSQTYSWVVSSLISHYIKTTPQRTKLIDLFMLYLVIVGGVQFLYCAIAGNYPFNAFLSGFSATVGQFVLTASLRVQTNASSNKEFASVSPERAFADYIVCSIILHFFCVNLIN
ncbi:hypothetical protein jhhlp_007344 [Lomentospora prolificans]|uniref:Dolichyl-diphosphooligosaccharide--protein glycosyltransferase subunit OST2 n=1 Tax=Lomentospora prolificans TaxID=41688 RepID=A0A2N3N2D9_9PEZI|nr:hypothetical protein jhhlp_007344 [Lomentospora prolificans]